MLRSRESTTQPPAASILLRSSGLRGSTHVRAMTDEGLYRVGRAVPGGFMVD
jgi:hypothetical protein